MAEVRPGDRAKTKQRTGDTTFPMETAAQIRSAIRLRHSGHSKGPAEVLALAARATQRLRRAGQISAGECQALMNKIVEARQADSARKA